METKPLAINGQQEPDATNKSLCKDDVSLKEMAKRFWYIDDAIIAKIQEYEQTGLLTETLVSDLMFAVFTYSDPVYRRSMYFYEYVIALCDKYNVSIQILHKLFYCGNVEGILCLIREYVKRNYPIEDCPRYSEHHDLFDFCYEHRINMVYCTESLVVALKNLKCRKRCQQLVNLYRDAGKLQPNSQFASTLMLIYDDFIEEYSDQIDGSFLDEILFQGSLSLIRKVLHRGHKFTDKCYRIYVPCHKCHNGENHSCNWQYVSTDYVALSRFGVSANHLINEPSGSDIYHPFWASYDDFAQNE